jgi:hypothetical protein
MVPQTGTIANYLTLPYGHGWQLGATLVIFNLDRCVVQHIQDICDLEYDVLSSLSEQLSWKDFPIECAYLFHTRIIRVFFLTNTCFAKRIFLDVLNNTPINMRSKIYYLRIVKQSYGFVNMMLKKKKNNLCMNVKLELGA